MTAMTTAGALAARFAAQNDEIVALVEGCTDAAWRRVTAEEGWPVGVTTHHIAIVQEAFVRLVGRLAAGATYSPTVAMDAIDRENAAHARDFAAVGKAETLAPLRASGEAIGRLLGGLDDADLARVAGTFGGNELSVGRVVEYVVIGHAAAHLASIRATLAA